MDKYLYYNQLHSLCNNLGKNSLIKIDEDNSNLHEDILEYLDLDDMQRTVKANSNITIDKSDLLYGYTSGLKLDWIHSKGEDWIYGGYQITLFDGLAFPSNFWKVYNDPPQSKEQEQFLNNLGYFQKSGHGDDGTFGCFYKEERYPCDILFYDSGIYWKLDLTLSEYFEALLKYKAVGAWQYFYISPRSIKEKLTDVNCKGWAFTALENMDDKPKSDGVLFHMNKIIRLFPTLFPDVDLTDAIKQRDSLKKLL